MLGKITELIIPTQTRVLTSYQAVCYVDWLIQSSQLPCVYLGTLHSRQTEKEKPITCSIFRNCPGPRERWAATPASPVLLGEGKDQRLGLTFGRCHAVSQMLTSLGLTGMVAWLSQRFKGVPHSFSGSVPEEPWNFHRCLLSSETHVSLVGALALRLIDCRLNDCLLLFLPLLPGCQENFPPLSASVSTCMLGPKTVHSVDLKGP